MPKNDQRVTDHTGDGEGMARGSEESQKNPEKKGNRQKPQRPQPTTWQYRRVLESGTRWSLRVFRLKTGRTCRLHPGGAVGTYVRKVVLEFTGWKSRGVGP